ncbi:MAG TPA: hypothetical protein ENI05_03930 [Porticoccus sp.]|nr:hypothetical protein [Porticoccus sp.]
MKLFKQALGLPAILAMAVLSLTGCGGEEHANVPTDSAKEASMATPTAPEIAIEAVEEAIQVVEETVEQVQKAAVAKVEEAQEAATEEVQKAVTENIEATIGDAEKAGAEATDDAVNNALHSLSGKLGQ